MSQRHPRFDANLYTDAAIADPYPVYRAIRDLGPAVWLSAHGVWAIARFGDVRAALRADRVLVSGRGVAMNELMNSNASRVTLTTDGDEHRRLRKALMTPMMPSTLKEVEAEIQQLADELVSRLTARDSFDGIVSNEVPLVGMPSQLEK
jgi:cytochrome P450